MASSDIEITAMAILVVPLVQLVNSIVTEPYMDEIFHVKQGIQYCQANFMQYDPKLTTPPGPYLVSALFLNGISQATRINFCILHNLRLFNALYALGTVWIIRKIRKAPNNGTARSIDALVIALFPVSFFFHLLYYTDSGSTFFVLYAYYYSIKGNSFMSALMGLVATSFRQTNIVWLAAFAAIHIARDFKVVSPTEKPMAESGSIGNVLATLGSLLLAVLKDPARVLAVGWPYIGAGMAFVAFVVWNKGIVLGDKSNHIPAMHFAQILYISGFIMFFTIPIWLSRVSISSFFTTNRLVQVSVLVPLCTMIVQRYTVEHPFLLADNRHYTFYIWRYLFRMHPLIRYALIPGYIFSFIVIGQQIGRSQQTLWCLAIGAATLLTLVPSPLLEFRYFIVPYLMYRLHIEDPGVLGLSLEAAWYLLFNAATIYMFLYRTFEWPSEPAVLQRFMY